ncbi:MAG: penicillin-binding protein 2 [Clostridiales bacterium]|nr:penicillin-binding protein 2 [Clostridiales bacterium]
MLALIIIIRLVDLQITHGAEYNKDSQSRLLKESDVTAPRGKIIDRYGVPIATNRQGFVVQIVKTGISNDELNEMLLQLAGILEKNGKAYNNSFGKFLTFNPLAFNDMNADEIKKWEINENRLAMEEKDVRTNPEELFKFLREQKFKLDSKYTDEEAYKIIRLRYEILIDNWNFITGGTVTLAKDVGMEVISEIEERHQEFSGIITDVIPMRQYLDAYNVGQVLGYVRPITAKQLEDYVDEDYESDDIIGQSGVEKVAERYLRGRDGKKSIEVDTSGRLTGQTETVQTIPGSDVVLTIDTNLQKVAIESLKKNIDAIRIKGDKNNFGDANAGAAVVMDVNTGEVLAMASYPSYDPAVYLAGSDDKISQQTISSIIDDKNKPLLNRAIMEIYAPGSTFKPLTAIAALESGVISTSNSRRLDSGTFVTAGTKGRILKCLEFPGYGHGWLNLKRALETSCNIYFYQIGTETGIDNLSKWANYFGLGEKTGIDLPAETAGYMSSKEVKKKLRNDDWRPADTAQVSIGQFDNAFTPLQMARYISAIANGGKLYKPYIVKKVVKYDGSTVNETQPSFVDIAAISGASDLKDNLLAIKEGMVAVTQSVDGTAMESFRDFPYTVAGKTGTAQTSSESTRSSNALFVCYAPAENPQIAVAVVIERGVWGSYTAPVARDILNAYFGLNKAESSGEKVLQEGAVFIE